MALPHAANVFQTMVLCGGLGSSPYVEKRIKSYVEDEYDGKVEVIAPRKPWSAIARGAAIRALEKDPVLFRKSRDNIGICVHEKWDEEKHDADDYWNSSLYGERARNQMRWHVMRVSTHLDQNVGWVANVRVGREDSAID